MIIGAGGHASVVTDLLQVMGVEIRGLTDQSKAPQHATVLDAPILGDDSVLQRFAPSQLCLANGLGVQPRLREEDPPDPGTALRRRVFERLNASGYSFPPIRHPGAIVASSATAGAGSQIMAGTVIQSRAVIHENAVINTGASVDHDCIVQAHAFIAPGVIVCGSVKIGAGALIGAGAILLPGVEIGEHALVAAGAVIRHDVGDREFAG
ncbi:MAG: NeuD/PglB/VioB family sugar acetyltransferase [Rhodomicrobiaceae bacterium]